MAFTSAGWKLSISFIDNGGDVTVRTYDLLSADYDAAVLDTAAMILAVDAIVDSVIIDYHYYENFVQDALVLPAAGVQNENQALLSYTIEGNPLKSATQSLPSPVIGIFTAASGHGANVVDVSDAALLTWAAFFITGAGQKATISDGETAASLDSGRRRHVRNRRG